VKSGERSVTELFIRGTEPQQRVGSNGGVCGHDIIQSGPEAEHSNWMAANRDWLRRAARGPGVRGGRDRTRTAYFYNGQYMPYGRSWGPLLGGGSGCETPPPPSCIPQPTPDASGVIPPLVLPSPSGSGPIAEPCPTRPPPTPTSQPSIEPSAEPTKTPPGKPSIEPSLVPSPEASPFAEAASSQP